MATVHIVIYGNVQGVFYRSTAKQKAKELNVTGWIRNEKNGNVAAIVSGNTSQLENFIKWCKTGPQNALVEKVVVQPIDDQILYGFEIIK